MLKANGYTVYIAQQGTIDVIKASGNLDLITNYSIHLAIVSWNAKLNSIREWERLDKGKSDDFSQYMKNNIDFYKMTIRKSMEAPISEAEKTTHVR